MEFAGKTAFVTGAGSGIGRATAIALAEAGAALCITDRSEASLSGTLQDLQERGVATFAAAFDVRENEQIVRAIAQTTDRFGGLDIAVNCAGILGGTAAFTEIELSTFRDILDINVTALFSCMQAELAVMLPAGRGAIVNVASAAGLRGAPGVAGYCASKHAVVGLTRAAATEYGTSGVRINAVCPGIVETPMTESAFSGVETVAALKRAHAMHRYGKSSEIADAILWLLSDRASFVTGAAVAVDGGFTAF